MRASMPLLAVLLGVLGVALAGFMSGCDNAAPRSHMPVVNDALLRDAAIAPAEDVAPAPPQAMATATVPAEATGRRHVPAHAVRIDARSMDRFVESLQEAEKVLDPNDMEHLRQALAVLLDRAQERFLAYTARTHETVPRDRVFELAFGDLHGATVEEVILAGAEHARTFLERKQGTAATGGK